MPDAIEPESILVSRRRAANGWQQEAPLAGVGVTMAARLLALQEETRAALIQAGAHPASALLEVENAMLRAQNRAARTAATLEQAAELELAVGVRAWQERRA